MHGPRSTITGAQCSHRLGATSILSAKLHLSQPPATRQTVPPSSVERWLRHARPRGYITCNGAAALRHVRHQLVARSPMRLHRRRRAVRRPLSVDLAINFLTRQVSHGRAKFGGEFLLPGGLVGSVSTPIRRTQTSVVRVTRARGGWVTHTYTVPIMVTPLSIPYLRHQIHATISPPSPLCPSHPMATSNS